MKAPLLPIPEEGPIDFTKRIRNVSVRYLNQQKPTKNDLNNWIVLPLYQKGQDMPLDDDGKTSILVAHVEVMRQLISDYEKKMAGEEAKPKRRNIHQIQQPETMKNEPKPPVARSLKLSLLKEDDIREDPPC